MVFWILYGPFGGIFASSSQMQFLGLLLREHTVSFEDPAENIHQCDMKIPYFASNLHCRPIGSRVKL